MKMLEKELYPRGIGMKVKSKQIRRYKKLCLYEREDNTWEVFFVKEQMNKIMFGNELEEKELYPSNEDFGFIAWCFNKKEKAISKYNYLKNNYRKIKKTK